MLNFLLLPLLFVFCVAGTDAEEDPPVEPAIGVMIIHDG